MSTQLRIRRIFNIAFGALAMLAVALISAFVTMRLAIHGREVQVPALARLTVADAHARAASKGLSVVVENRFYSTAVPAGLILSQLPAANEVVRRDTQIRVTESLGSQKVTIPDVVGQSERSATVALRRLGLELDPIAYLPTPGPADFVLAQSPPPNAEGIDGPRISLLISQTPDPAPGSRPASSMDEGLVMPSLIGLSANAAAVKAASVGLHIVVPQAGQAAVDPDATIVTEVAETPVAPTGNVIGQYPASGHRIARGGGVRLIYAQPAVSVDSPAPPI